MFCLFIAGIMKLVLIYGFNALEVLTRYYTFYIMYIFYVIRKLFCLSLIV